MVKNKKMLKNSHHFRSTGERKRKKNQLNNKNIQLEIRNKMKGETRNPVYLRLQTNRDETRVKYKEY